MNYSIIIHRSAFIVMPMSLTLRVLDALPQETIHASRNWTKADVREAVWPSGSSQRVIIKDLRGRPLWFRLFYGRHILRREWNALRVLSGTEGVPNVVARPHPDVLVMEKLSGQSLNQLGKNVLDEAAISRLESLLESLHARGVTHGDLHASNILMDENGAIHLIDWATARIGGGRLFQELRQLDLRSLAKVKMSHARHLVTDADLDLLERRSWAYRAVKSVRHKIDKMRGRKNKNKLGRKVEKLRLQRAAEDALSTQKETL